MKKFIRSITCFVMAMIMALSGTVVAFAKEQVTPVIMVHGMGGSTLYENPNTPYEKAIENLGFGDVADKLLGDKDLLLQLINLLDQGNTLDTNVLINRLNAFATSCQMNCDKDGNAQANVGVNNYWTDSMANHKSYYKNATTSEAGLVRQFCDTVGAKNVYLFSYDTRLDVCQTAEKLNSYINTVKKKTKSKKVTLVGCSLGGSVLSAYVDAHKNKKDIKRLIFVNPAYEGVDVARVYAKDLVFDKKAVNKYISRVSKDFDGGAQEVLLNVIISLLDTRANWAVDNLNNIIKDETLVNRLYNEVLYPLLGNVPSFWECLPYDSFDKAVSQMSAIGFLDKSSGLYAKICHYHAVQGRLKKNLKAVKKQGVEIAIFVSYGLMGIPVTSQSANQTDMLIDAKYASIGAKVAKYGKKLNATGKYVSKDKIINAKSCLLRDNTWFIKGIHHMGMTYGGDIDKLIANVTAGKVKCNLKAVNKKYKYSQFIKSDEYQNLTNVKK